MQIDLTDNEYRLLVEALYLADWMMHSYAINVIHEDHAALKEKLFSYYTEAQADDVVEQADEMHFVTTEVESVLHDKFIEAYDDQVFREELIDRLAKRDVMRQVGGDEFLSMNKMERGKKIETLKACYADEFARHGLDCIHFGLTEAT